MSKLYEISERYKNLEDLLDNPELENIKEELEKSIDSIQEEFDLKAENIAKFIKSLEVDSKGLKEESQRLQSRKKTVDNRISSLKEYLFEHMQALKKNKIKGKVFTLSIQNNPVSIEITDEKAIPQKYIVPQETKFDKKALLKDLKNDVLIDGVDVKQTQGLRIR